MGGLIRAQGSDNLLRNNIFLVLMEIVGQATMIRACLGVYATHMISIVLWLSLCILALRRQRRMKLEVVGAKPTEWEYYGIRLCLCYVLADAVRGVDGMFDNPQ